MRIKQLITIFTMTTIISCKTIGPDFANEVFKNKYLTASYIFVDKDSIYHYTSEYKFQGASAYHISGNEIWEGGFYESERDTWLIKRRKIVSVPPYKFEFKPLSKKEEAEFLKKIEENN